jgi:hypothetical protein
MREVAPEQSPAPTYAVLNPAAREKQVSEYQRLPPAVQNVVYDEITQH